MPKLSGKDALNAKDVHPITLVADETLILGPQTTDHRLRTTNALKSLVHFLFATVAVCRPWSVVIMERECTCVAAKRIPTSGVA